MNNPWYDLQVAVKTRLQSSTYFGDVPILTEDAGDIETAVQTALTRGALVPSDSSPSKCGVAVLILTPRASGTETTRRHLLTDTIVRVLVFERGVVNRGSSGIGKPALDVLWEVVRMVQGWRPNDGAVPARLNAWDSEESPEDEGTLLQYFADFELRQSIPISS